MKLFNKIKEIRKTQIALPSDENLLLIINLYVNSDEDTYMRLIKDRFSKRPYYKYQCNKILGPINLETIKKFGINDYLNRLMLYYVHHGRKV